MQGCMRKLWKPQAAWRLETSHSLLFGLCWTGRLTARNPRAQPHSHTKTHCRLPATQHTEERKGSAHLSPSFLLLLSHLGAGGRTLQCRLAPRCNAALQMEQRQLPPFNCGNSAFLTYSILSLERAMRGRSYFFPQVERQGENWIL